MTTVEIYRVEVFCKGEWLTGIISRDANGGLSHNYELEHIIDMTETNDVGVVIANMTSDPVVTDYLWVLADEGR